MDAIDRHVLDQRIAAHRGRAIVTGMLEYAGPEDLALFHQLLGSGTAFQADYEIYFHWYNLIHELGHIARSELRLGYVGTTPVVEEEHVNRFAVAYWKQHGDPPRLQELDRIVSSALARSTPYCQPAELLHYYGQQTNFQRACRSPQEYGFLQFSLVRHALDQVRHDFPTELAQQGFTFSQLLTKAPPLNAPRSQSMQAIVDEAVGVLRTLGFEIPDVEVFPHYSLMEHRAI